jgi:hypothetical protein
MYRARSETRKRIASATSPGGVVEEGVDAPEAIDRGGYGLRPGGGVAHVGDGGHARRAGGLALGAQRLELLRGAHLVAGVGERRGPSS